MRRLIRETLLCAFVILLTIGFISASKCPKKCVCNPVKKWVTCNGKSLKEPLSDILQYVPTNTVRLDVENYNFTILRNLSFASLPQLQILNLPHNSINFIEEGAFSGLGNLQKLDLSRNNLSYLDNSFVTLFDGALNLKELSFEETNLRTIPERILSKLRTLSKLNVGKNEITNATLGTGFRNLTQLKELQMHLNKLSSLTNRTFSNIRQSKLIKLNLLRSNIKSIESGTFSGLPHMQQLNLTGNYFQMGKRAIDAMLKPLCNAQITTLYCDQTNLQNITGTFSCFTQLTFLDISGNKLKTLEDGVFKSQNRLKILNIKKNFDLHSFSKNALQGLTRLKVLNFSKSKLSSLPVFIDKNGTTFLPRIDYINLGFNSIEKTDNVYGRSPFSGLQNIASLYLSHNHLYSLTNGLLDPLRRIQFLSMDNNKIKSVDKHVFTNLHTLKKLNMDGNLWEIREVCFFANLTNLEHLDLSGIKIQTVNNLKQECLFEGLVNLKMLDLTETNLKRLPPRMFKDLRKLEKLHMAQNSLREWDDTIFENLTSITFLDVANNELRAINRTSLQSILPTLNHFQGYANPYVCDCNLDWYADWVRRMHAAKNFTLKIAYNLPYNCSNLNKKSLLLYRPTFFECHRLLIILSASGFGLVILIILSISLLYNYRWYIRYWMFLLRSRRTFHLEEQDRLLYTYDCFITYSGEDSKMVTQQLLPRLERDFGFKMCIHERDFKLGKPISENIAESIEQSRKILVVLTKNFVQSEWCKFEVNLAHANTLHNASKARQSLIIILVEDVKYDLMTPILRYLMRKKTFIEWTEDDQGRRLFWSRLKEAIQGHGDVPNLEDD